MKTVAIVAFTAVVVMVFAAFRLNRPQLNIIDAAVPEDFPSGGFSHQLFEDLLKTYVDGAGELDYDAWHEEVGPVDVSLVVHHLHANADKARRLVARLARDFPAEHEPCPIHSDRALEHAIITAKEHRDPALVAKLDAVAGRVIGR